VRALLTHTVRVEAQQVVLGRAGQIGHEIGDDDLLLRVRGALGQRGVGVLEVQEDRAEHGHVVLREVAGKVVDVAVDDLRLRTPVPVQVPPRVVDRADRLHRLHLALALVDVGQRHHVDRDVEPGLDARDVGALVLHEERHRAGRGAELEHLAPREREVADVVALTAAQVPGAGDDLTAAELRRVVPVAVALRIDVLALHGQLPLEVVGELAEVLRRRERRPQDTGPVLLHRPGDVLDHRLREAIAPRVDALHVGRTEQLAGPRLHPGLQLVDG
jgi:hypothetical protein